MKKINLKNALLLWQLEQKPTLSNFRKWLKTKKYEIPPEGEKFKRQLAPNGQEWTVGFTEEGVKNPQYSGLCCGRIELWNGGDYPFKEYNVCLPYDIMEIFKEILEVEN